MSIAQTVFLKMKDLPEQQAQEILDFVDFIQHRYVNHQQPTIKPTIQQYAGMIKIKATGKKRDLNQFDPASVVAQH